MNQSFITRAAIGALTGARKGVVWRRNIHRTIIHRLYVLAETSEAAPSWKAIMRFRYQGQQTAEIPLDYSSASGYSPDGFTARGAEAETMCSQAIASNTVPPVANAILINGATANGYALPTAVYAEADEVELELIQNSVTGLETLYFSVVLFSFEEDPRQ